MCKSARSAEWAGSDGQPVLWVLRMTLFPLFGSNHAMLRDWYDHTLYFGMLLFGFTLVRQPALWLAIDRLRWPRSASASAT
jgi:hypothetical protein